MQPRPLFAFADRLGRFFEEHGWPRMAGRVLAHLLVCDPPEQTFEEIVGAVGASRSTVSVVTRLLQQLGLIERYSIASQRADRYRVKAGAWTFALEQELTSARRLRGMAEEGLELLSDKPSGSRARLREMRDFYAFLEQAYPPLLARWQKRR